MSTFSLRPHQERNRDHLIAALKQFGAAIDMSEGGVGKTLTALSVCQKVNARPVVITRKAIISGWESDARKIGIEPMVLTNYEQLTRGKHPLCKKVVTARKVDGKPHRWHYEWKQGLGRVIFIFDESQICGEMAGEASKVMLAACRAYKTLLLSATPFATPVRAGPTMIALRLCGSSEWHSKRHEYGVVDDPLGGSKFIGDMKSDSKMLADEYAKLGLQFMEKIHHEILPSRGCRTRRSEIPGFPATQIRTTTVSLPAPSSLIAPYLDLIAEARVADLQRVRDQIDPALWELAEVLPLVEDLRDRQESEVRKLPIFEEMIEQALEEGDSVAVFLNFDHAIEALAKRFDTKNIIRGNRRGNGAGGSESYDRGQRIWRFQNNLDRLIIVNSAAGGAGISLHDETTQRPRTTVISPPWSATVLKQVLFRPHRLGGGFSRQWLVFADNAIEQRVRVRVENRVNNIDMLTDGDLSHEA